MKDKFLKMLRAKEAKKAELQIRSKATEDVKELRSINDELTSLNAEIEELRGMIDDCEAEERAAAEKEKAEAEARKKAEEEEAARTKAIKDAEARAAQTQAKDYTPGKGFESRGKAVLAETEKENRAKAEERGKVLKEGRAITVASSNVVVPSFFADNIKGTFLQVSNLLDAVDVIPLNGGESYRQPFEKATADADYKAEGAQYATAETTFGYSDITKAKITAYNEITEEVEKLPAAPYADVVLGGVSRSLRKKLAKEIMVGTGQTNTLTGIFNASTDVIPTATDLEISAIDNTTLDSIVFGYGGDEAVEGSCVLILNKKDLAAFSRLRTTDGKKFHTIIPAANGGSGTIDGIPYIINSACGAVSDASTAANTYCMAYGNLKNYQLAVFSDIDIKRSEDYKFKEGMIAHKGVVFAGGNVVSYKGFLRVKKVAAQAASDSGSAGGSGEDTNGEG